MSDLSDLLRIDADAAARKLSEKRYRSATDAIVALVRLAVSFAPSSVRMTIDRGHLEIVSKGGAVDGAVFRYAAALFNSSGPESVRIEALRRLEGRPGAAFLAAFSEKYSRVFVAWREEGGIVRFIEFTPHQPPRGGILDEEVTFHLTVVGKLGSGERAVEAARACRFSTVPIFVNNKRVNRGPVLPGCLLQKRFEVDGFCGTLGIPREGTLSTLTRLQSGIVVEESLYGERRGLILDVLVEGADDVEGRDILDKLRDGGSMLYRDLAARYGELDPADRLRAKDRLTARYEHSFDRYLVAGLKFFECVDGRLVDLFDIKQRAAKERMFAVEKGIPHEHYRTRNRFVLRLDAAERKFLYQSIGLRVVEPPRRVSPNGVRLAMQRMGRHFLNLFRKRGTLMAFDALGDAERRFCEILTSFSKRKIYLQCTTGKRLHPIEEFEGGRRIVVPLENRTVRRMMKAVLRTPELAPSALLFLTEGTIGSDAEKRYTG